jgi:hypothetical protein
MLDKEYNSHHRYSQLSEMAVFMMAVSMMATVEDFWVAGITRTTS